MKHTRKLVTLIVVLAMVMAFMAPTVFAANDGTIKIVNTTANATYTIFKVFDATYSGDNVSYTYNGSNATFLANLQADNSPFAVTKNSSGSYNIVEKADITDDAIITFIKNNANNLGDAVTTATGDGNDVTISNLAYGYYYITTTTGTVVTIDSALKDVVVIDKNESLAVPAKTQSVANNEYTDDVVTANVGDTVNYKVTGNLTRYNGETLVTNLVLTDVMTDGLTCNKDVVVKIDGQIKVADTDYTVAYNATGFVVTITTATVASDGEITYKYDVGDAYEITYSATVDSDTINDGTETNTINLKYNTNADVGSDSVIVNNYDITLTKVNESDVVLADAQFLLYDAATNGNNIPVVKVSGTGDASSTEDNVYRPAVSGETGVTMITGTTGKIIVKGLANGTYHFEETKQPEGYNILTARAAAEIANANDEISVLNKSGSVLPSTGGMGTTIFYVLGGLLAVGALVVLVTNKRMRGTN